MRLKSVTYLENDSFRFGNETGALESSSSHDLRSHNVFLLPDHGLCHVLLLKQTEFGSIGLLPDLSNNLVLLGLLQLRQFEFIRHTGVHFKLIITIIIMDEETKV